MADERFDVEVTFSDDLDDRVGGRGLTLSAAKALAKSIVTIGLFEGEAGSIVVIPAHRVAFVIIRRSKAS